MRNKYYEIVIISEGDPWKIGIEAHSLYEAYFLAGVQYGRDYPDFNQNTHLYTLKHL